MAVTLIVLGNKEELNGVFAVSKSNVISAYVPLTLPLNKLGIDNFKVSICQRFKTYFTCRTTFVAQTGTAWLSVG